MRVHKLWAVPACAVGVVLGWFMIARLNLEPVPVAAVAIVLLLGAVVLALRQGS